MGENNSNLNIRYKPRKVKNIRCILQRAGQGLNFKLADKPQELNFMLINFHKLDCPAWHPEHSIEHTAFMTKREVLARDYHSITKRIATASLIAWARAMHGLKRGGAQCDLAMYV
jgi:phenylalanyl-tRNA synthetase alpha subunit